MVDTAPPGVPSCSVTCMRRKVAPCLWTLARTLAGWCRWPRSSYAPARLGERPLGGTRPSTLAVVWGNVNSLFSAAVADRVIGISSCIGVALPDVPHHSHYITYVGEWPDTDSETRSIIDAALGSVPRMCPVPLPGGRCAAR
jgi:hypothetical protein